MRYPDTPAMTRTFELARNRLKLDGKMKDYTLKSENAFLHYNGIRTTITQYATNFASNDFFKVADTPDNKEGYVPKSYFDIGYDALYKRAIDPFRQYFVEKSFEEAFKKLLEYDEHSVRSYMITVLKYPNSVVRWIETMQWHTGILDAGLSETVLESLAFDDPRVENPKWYYFE